MGQSFYGNTIEDLKSSVNIVDVIGSVVQLKRAGANYKGVCPFHNEKTPSFVVSEQKQIFTCFGCGESGDVIKFVQRYYNLDFKEAAEKLARENGIEISFGTVNPYKDRYYEANKEAARFFYQAFSSVKNRGYSYMKDRGIDDVILKKFGIGYADEKWDSLYTYLKDKGYEEKFLLELGLISEKDGKYYDKFRNRVMFPIINTSGKVIGFGGRALGDDSPKYLNSPENIIFQKKNNLYGLNTTKQDIGRTGYGILVEGYMDAISLYQHGVKNVGASLGTALTENQAKLIKRYSKNIVLSYDADNAGRNAAMRGIEVLSSQGCNVKVLHVTDGKDPDEYIKQHGKEAFLKLVEGALPMIEYKLEGAARGLDLLTDEGKLQYMKKASEILRTLNPVEADIYIKKLSKDLKIAEGAIRMEILGNNNRDITKHIVVKDDRKTDVSITRTEASLLKALTVEPGLVERLNTKIPVKSSLAQRTLNIIFDLYGSNEDYSFSDILDRLSPEEAEILSDAFEREIIAGNADIVFSDCMAKINIQTLIEERNKINDMISLADEEADEERVNELTVKLMELDVKIKSYGGKS